MADIFLSYAQADAKRAKQVADALSAKGWSVWWDATLVPGTRFRDEIEKQLHAARCVVVLWSKTSVKSDWVIDEADDGKKRGVLIQALIEDVRPPHGFRQIQFATLTGWDGSDSGEFTRLCGGINAYAPFSRSSRDVLSTDARQPDAPRRVQTAPAPDCTYTISRSSVLISALGGSRSVRVSTAKGCAWTATSNASWIALTSGASGTGDGSVAFNVAANTGVAHSGTLTIAGHAITVQQAPAAAEAGRATPEQWKDLERRFKHLNKATLCAVLSLWTS